MPDLSKAVSALRSGGVIAYPTEAVFGLGCDPHDEAALARIIDIKSRDAHKGFILIAATQAQLSPFLAPIEPSWQTQFDAAWPGPVTFVVPARQGISELLSGSRDTLAVRVSNHPLVQRLCEDFGGAIVSTSANRSGQEPCRDTATATTLFGPQLDAIVQGQIGTLSAPTRIIDVRTGAQLR
ncbi:L-threonylcarbamoyladenylate synthase [Granulosicoccus antarcticus]|uniref:Threonylcarbamoyl-AMP synthase n=1 Tax=Granulosicoccus antarcticus IMCC3135 TaxID=1192854 RepID=A0A2Z2NJV3_9GAMM|nr:L-threonylcarbamoyladenylate synthase [Granulosicoccus antarcticus]ASJ71459.1 Threonylcarbamoyl-AMP synthase [Granulosicoccus antarcticus IMCC3135]